MAPYKGTKIVTYHRSGRTLWSDSINAIGYVGQSPASHNDLAHDRAYRRDEEAGRQADCGRAVFVKTPGDRQAGWRSSARDGALGRWQQGRDRLHQLFDFDGAPSRPPSRTQLKVGQLDSTIFVFLLPAIAATLIMAGIHAYLGLHVVARGVTSGSLTGAIASLGAAIAVWQGYDPHGPSLDEPVYALGALIFAVIKGTKRKILQPPLSVFLCCRLGGRDPDDEQVQGRLST